MEHTEMISWTLLIHKMKPCLKVCSPSEMTSVPPLKKYQSFNLPRGCKTSRAKRGVSPVSLLNYFTLSLTNNILIFFRSDLIRMHSAVIILIWKSFLSVVTGTTPAWLHPKSITLLGPLWAFSEQHSGTACSFYHRLLTLKTMLLFCFCFFLLWRTFLI